MRQNRVQCTDSGFCTLGTTQSFFAKRSISLYFFVFLGSAKNAVLPIKTQGKRDARTRLGSYNLRPKSLYKSHNVARLPKNYPKRVG